MTHGEWDQHRGAFAAQLPLERWSDLHAVYGLVESISAAAHLHEESDRLNPVEREELVTATQMAAAAADALEADAAAGEHRRGRPLGRAHRILLRHP